MRHLSKRANQVLKLAHEAAHEYGLGYVGTEHLLLGIVREGTSLGARILLDHGATEYRTKAMVDELVKERLDETWVTGRLPGSPQFVDVFARAERIAERLKQPQIYAEHLLAALLTETGCVGCEVLRAMGISREIVENAFHEQVPAGCS
jgi:ATP-dependent Clp protease ATP-binding subunit ClpC